MTFHPSTLPKVIPNSHSSKSNLTHLLLPWDSQRLEQSFSSYLPDPSASSKILFLMERKLQEENRTHIHVEEISDLVETVLIDHGFAKAALLYGKNRARREIEREIQIPPETLLDPKQLELASQDQINDLQHRISLSTLGLNPSLSEREILNRLLQSTSLSLSPSEYQNTIILNAKALLDLDSDSRFLAGRILLTYIYEETLPWKIKDGPQALKEAHRKAFQAYIPKGIAYKRLDPRLAQFELETLANAIDPYADLQFDFLGIQTLYDRYLIHHSNPQTHRKQRLEAPQIFWMRVAMGLSLNEPQKETRAIEFYQIYKQRLGCSSTPTLFNAGTLHPQLSSCYLLTCNDSLESINDTWVRSSQLSKWAGGLGCSWTSVRGAGAHIQGTNGESTGVIPFLKVANDIALAVNQGGKRPGALCSYLETWHSDIEDFLDLRKETGDERRRTHNMNTAHWIPDLFMKRLKDISDGKLTKEATWTLFRSSQTPDLHDLYGQAFEKRYLEYETQAELGLIYGKKIRVLQLWKRMLETLFETGHPWLTFKDPCNLRSPQDHQGVIHSSNLCTEITLNTSQNEISVCNLASVNLHTHLTTNGDIDHPKLKHTVETLLRILDNVIDLNFYPVEAAKTSNLKHRPVGLGVMGVQDAMYQKRIPFDSHEAVAFHDEFMEAIAFYAYQASSNLAQERGVYPTYQGSKWDRGMLPLDTLSHLETERGISIEVNRSSKLPWDQLKAKIQIQGIRNSNCLAIAPTATISNILGCSPCVEPTYKHIHTKSNLSGDFIRTNDHLLKDLQALGLWDSQMLKDLKYHDGSIQSIDRIPPNIRDLYKTAFEIKPTWILQCASVRQKWIDQAQSTNLWLADADARAASFMYREAWARGLKTTYYLRTLNKSSIDSSYQDRKPKATPAEAAACSIEAMRTGGTCEACQ